MDVIDEIQVWPGLIGKILLTTGVLQLGLLQILVATASAATVGTVVLTRGQKPGITVDGSRRVYDADFTVEAN
jgi:hypothetical protein